MSPVWSSHLTRDNDITERVQRQVAKTAPQGQGEVGSLTCLGWKMEG